MAGLQPIIELPEIQAIRYWQRFSQLNNTAVFHINQGRAVINNKYLITNKTKMRGKKTCMD
ncbi:hypothetical protein [Butyrivibrio sp. WCE2006]|uniref:hypothetical protein n=1 Tax=Butyrivibrio sp. WCE2006 TaxID=1410611 RepID=UPI0005D27D6D|nr:hypothetical protein [Butyrivibrio sp. WCE2006]